LQKYAKKAKKSKKCPFAPIFFKTRPIQALILARFQRKDPQAATPPADRSV
jgi:hypothetical protein